MPTMKTLTIGGTTYDLEGGVTSVNGQTGAVVLGAADVGAATEQDIADAIIQVLPVDSASGSIASFPDGYPAPVEALSCAITPVQDLHGQSSPYPAGAINVIPPADAGSIVSGNLTIDSDGNGKYRLHGTGGSAYTFLHIPLSDSFVCPPSSTHKFCMMNSVGYANVGLYFYNDDTQVTDWAMTPANRVATGYVQMANKTINKIVISVPDSITIDVTFSPMIIPQATATSPFIPYSNLCPITGWSEAVVTRTGANVLKLPIYYRADSTVPEMFFIKKGTYTLHYSVSGATSWRVGVWMRDKNGNNLSDNAHKPNAYWSWYSNPGDWMDGANGTTTSYPITIAEDCYVRFFFVLGDTTASTVFSNPMLNVGSTATPYSPYTAQTVTIDLSGTRYGGTLDVLTGVLTITKERVDLGELSWTYESDVPRFYSTGISSLVKRPSSGSVLANIMCTTYAVNPSDNVYTSADKIIGVSAGGAVNAKDTAYTSAPSFKTAMSGQYLVYELATPLSVQLTASELETILGQNNIWANCGDVAVSYRADIQKYIDKKTS